MRKNLQSCTSLGALMTKTVGTLLKWVLETCPPLPACHLQITEDWPLLPNKADTEPQILTHFFIEFDLIVARFSSNAIIVLIAKVNFTHAEFHLLGWRQSSLCRRSTSPCWVVSSTACNNRKTLAYPFDLKQLSNKCNTKPLVLLPFKMWNIL